MRAVAPLAVLFVFMLDGCASLGRGRGRSPDFDASSLQSDYAPAGRFRGFVRLTSDSLFVLVDSALITVPGPNAAASPPAVGRVAISLHLAADSADRWRALAGTEPVALADTLRLGETRAYTQLRFAVALPAGFDATRSWLLFRFHGTPLRSGGGAVRTFVCSPTNLAGPPSHTAARAARLRANYTAAC